MTAQQAQKVAGDPARSGPDQASGPELPADVWPQLPAEVRAAWQRAGADTWRHVFDGIPGAVGPWRALRPLFMRRDHVGELADVSARLARLVLAACRRRAANAGELHDLLEIPDGELPLLDRSVPLTEDLLISLRPDIMYRGGVPRFVELNIDGAVGGNLHADLIAARFLDVCTRQLPDAGWLAAAESSARSRYAAIRAALGPGARRVCIPVFRIGAVAGVDEDPQAFVRWLAPMCEAGRDHGFDVIAFPLTDLRLDERGRLCADGQPLDVVIRLFMYSDQPPSPGLDALGRAVRSGTVAMHTPEATYPLADKRTLAWLWSDLPLLGEADAALVRRHVPWTACLPAGAGPDDPLLRRALAAREGTVLKPGDGHGGRGVVIGTQTSPERWHDALASAARDGGYVLQEYTYPDLIELDFVRVETGEIRTERVPFTMGPFLFGLRPSGVLIRHGTPGGDLVVNVHVGALPNGVLLVERPC